MKIRLNEKTVAALVLPPGKAQLVVWDKEQKGFGVVVGKHARTLIAERRVDGVKRRTAIGVLGDMRPEGSPWTVMLARDAALEALVKMARGIDPNAAKRSPEAGTSASGPTLRDALTAHVARMERKQRAERSIETITNEITKYLAEYLDKPIAELTGAVLIAKHEEIKRDAKTRRGSNPENPKGATVANRVVIHVGACWNSLNRKLEGALGTWNPAKAVDRDLLTAKRERVADDDLPGWWAKVQTLPPVRRDLQIFVAFTGMRSEAARHVRWEHVAEKQKALLVPNPKGGESKAFTLPLGPTVMALLRERKRDNADAFADHDGDHGWVFPSLTRDKPYRVIPLAEAKERRVDEKTGERIKWLPGMHPLRRTYLSVAAEVGVTELDRSVLANHAYGSQSVNESYIQQAFSHLLQQQTKIDRALHARIKGKKP